MRPSEDRPIAGAGAGSGAGPGAGVASEGSEISQMPEVTVFGLSERVDVGPASQDALLAEGGDVKKHLNALLESIGHVKRSLSDDSSGLDKQEVAEQSAIQKLLARFAKGLSHKLQDLRYYVRPDVLTELPGSYTVGEYVAEVEDGKREDASTGLLAEVDDYLASDGKVLLLLGEPGAGKSLFAWYSTQARLAQYRQVLEGEEPGVTPWVPVVIDLKNYTLSEIIELLPSYLKKVCKLSDEELSAIQHDRKPQHKLLVVLDGFDELKHPSAGEHDIHKSFADCFTACGAKAWYAGQVKLVVTCRVRHLPDRGLERQYFAHGGGEHYRRRILLPFSSKKIAAYLQKRARHNESSEGATTVADYLKVLERSKSVEEMVRSPFVLRLYAEALPKLKETGVPLVHISRFDIYQAFVSQWFERNVKKLDDPTQVALGVDALGIEKVAQSFAHYAAILANEMYRRNSLEVDLTEVRNESGAFKVWRGLREAIITETKKTAHESLVVEYQNMRSDEQGGLREKEGVVDASGYASKHYNERFKQLRQNYLADLQKFKLTSPLRQTGEHYSFVHKSFYEYFLAVGIIQTAVSDKALAERVVDTLAQLGGLPDYGSRRLWQEPEALDFVCEYWIHASRVEKDQLKETWFAVIEATKGCPERGVAGGNAITLLNWVNVSMTYKLWQGVQIPGADLRNAYLEGSDLSGADLRGAWLGKIQANLVCVRGANLMGVEFCQRPAVILDDLFYAIAYHPTKNRVAVAEGERVRQYDFDANRWLEPSLEGHDDKVTSVSYDVDGEWLASGSRDRTIRQWRADTGEARGAPLVGHTGWVMSVSYSRDGEWLASGSDDKTIRQWSAADGEARRAPLVGHTSRVTSVSYSSDGEWLASASLDNTILQWRASSGEQRGAPLVGHTDWVRSVSYSPDGEWLASGSTDKTICQWRADSGELRGAPLVGHTRYVTCVSYSGDGQWLASGSGDRTIRQWHAASGEMRGAPLEGHTDSVISVSYSGDGRWLVSGSWDKTIRQWLAASGEQRGAPHMGHTDRVTSVSYSGDGKWLASGSWDNKVHQWRADTGEARGVSLEGHTDFVTSVSYSADGEWLASGSFDKTIRQWRASSGELRGVPLEGHTDWVRSVSYSVDGKWLASGSWDCSIRQWAAASGEQRGAPLGGRTSYVTSVNYSGDGEWLAGGSDDRAIRQWRASSGELRGAPLTGHTDWVRSVSYSGDGKWLASGSDDRTIRQWHAASGEARGVPLEGHTGSVTSVSYSGDGEWLASGSDDRTIRQWDAESGELRGAPLVGHTDLVKSVSYSGNGKYLASGSDDGTVRVWRREIEARGGGVSDEAEGAEVWLLAWGSKSSRMQLSASGMKLAGAIGLEPHQLELLRQHGYEIEEELASDDTAENEAFAAGAEESKTEPPETKADAGSGVGQQLASVGLFADQARDGSATSGGVEEAKAPDSCAELSGQPSPAGDGRLNYLTHSQLS